MAQDVLFVEIRGRRCALPLPAVRQVAPVPSLTPVPLAPPVIRGVAPLGGQVLPLVDLGPWLPGNPDPLDTTLLRAGTAQLVIVETTWDDEAAPVRAALAVDRVTRVGTIEEGHSRPPPPASANFLTAIVLDVDGPALFVDPAAALEQVREILDKGGPS